eukprot:3179814-Amphidinium_carterae.1
MVHSAPQGQCSAATGRPCSASGVVRGCRHVGITAGQRQGPRTRQGRQGWFQRWQGWWCQGRPQRRQRCRERRHVWQRQGGCLGRSGGRHIQSFYQGSDATMAAQGCASEPGGLTGPVRRSPAAVQSLSVSGQ